MIRAREVSKVFTTDAGSLTVLKNVSISIDAGEFIAIMGASGAGKSTLLHILGTLDLPSTGSIEIDGRDISRVRGSELTTFRNRSIGFVFQFHHLLPEFSALENAMMPGLIGGLPYDEAQRRAGYLLEELGLSGRLKHRPGELSGGEQQRVAVARALVMEPKMVLADEPTGNLDTVTGEELFELLYRINRKRGTTFVIVTHNDELAARCDRIIQMKDGMIQDGVMAESELQRQPEHSS